MRSCGRFWPRHTRNNGGKIEFQFLRISDVTFLRNTPKSLCLVIIFVSLDCFIAAAGRLQIIHAFSVNREEAHCRAVFGRHVRDGRAIHDRQRCCTRPEEFYKLADDFRLAKHLRDRECEVGGGHTFAQGAGHVNAHDIRCQEINWLAQHARLGFDTTDTPAHNAQAVDHRRVRIRADERVGIINAIRFQHTFGEVFEIHLMHDADAGRNDFERLKRLHAPLEKLIALTVAGKFQIQIARHGIRRASEIHLHRVIHHQVHRHQRLDDLGILAHLRHRRTHGR